MVRIESKILGCEIAIVETDAERVEALDKRMGLVLYSRDEVERMRGLPPDTLRDIHDLKRRLGGTYEGPADTDWPERTVPEQESLFDVTERRSFDGDWGDEVMVEIGGRYSPGVVTAVWDNAYERSHVTVELQDGTRHTAHASEVTPCAV